MSEENKNGIAFGGIRELSQEVTVGENPNIIASFQAPNVDDADGYVTLRGPHVTLVWYLNLLAQLPHVTHDKETARALLSSTVSAGWQRAVSKPKTVDQLVDRTPPAAPPPPVVAPSAPAAPPPAPAPAAAPPKAPAAPPSAPVTPRQDAPPPAAPAPQAPSKVLVAEPPAAIAADAKSEFPPDALMAPDVEIEAAVQWMVDNGAVEDSDDIAPQFQKWAEFDMPCTVGKNAEQIRTDTYAALVKLEIIGYDDLPPDLKVDETAAVEGDHPAVAALRKIAATVASMRELIDAIKPFVVLDADVIERTITDAVSAGVVFTHIKTGGMNTRIRYALKAMSGAPAA